MSTRLKLVSFMSIACLLSHSLQAISNTTIKENIIRLAGTMTNAIHSIGTNNASQQSTVVASAGVLSNIGSAVNSVVSSSQTSFTILENAATVLSDSNDAILAINSNPQANATVTNLTNTA